MKPRLAWLFTQHSPREIFSHYNSIDSASDLILAVDNGLQQIDFLGLTPNLIIGDFDSVDPSLLAKFNHVEQKRYPTKKNETDTELALNWCLEREAREIVICNDLGGRFDHALALLQNLLRLHEMRQVCRIESERQQVWFLDRQTFLPGLNGCLLSLLAWGSEAIFADSTGLSYPLRGLKLKPDLTRGISNLIVGTEVSIALEKGKALAVLTKLD